jgi:hypothetical protein
MTRIMLGVPRLGDPPWPFVKSLLALNAPSGFTFVERGPAPVDIARNQIVATFLQSPCSHLLMVDTDAVIHPNTLARLLSWRVPVVAALAFMRRGPLLPTVYRGQSPDDPDAFQTRIAEVHEYCQRHNALVTSQPVVLEPRPDDALFEVDRTGCHCVLIERPVLETVMPPWFVRDEEHNAREDFYFYEQCKAAGFPVYVDLSCMAAHLYGDRPLAALDHIVWDRVSQYEARPQESP